MDKFRKAIERLYDDVCTVYEQMDVTDEDTKITEQEEVAVLENQKCKLSYQKIATTSNTTGAAEITTVTKLFISPNVVINPGSKIVVTHKGIVTEFCSSGVPAHYKSHQEIELKMFERWA